MGTQPVKITNPVPMSRAGRIVGFFFMCVRYAFELGYPPKYIHRRLKMR
jgi:hypothetical protein